jgi:hypothetical protein
VFFIYLFSGELNWVRVDVAVRGEHGHGADGARAAKGAGTHIQGADRRPREQTGADADAPVHPRHLPAPSQTVGHGHCGKAKFPHGSFALKQIMRSARSLATRAPNAFASHHTHNVCFTWAARSVGR